MSNKRTEEHAETHACDLISRQAAIDALNEYFARIGKLKRRGLTKGEKAISLDTVGTIKALPSAEPEERALHESCTDCPLYDHARHSCPRFNKVIPETLREAQPDKRLEKIADLVEGTINHFDRDDAMDLLYQIKEVLNEK